MKASIVIYTHTDVKDVWKPFFGQTEKYLSEYEKIIFVNKDDELIPSNYKKVFYDDSKVYRERLLMCLEQITDELIIFHHEDMFLYAQPDIRRIELYSDRITKTNYSYVKLIKAGNSVGFPDEVYPEMRKFNKTFDYIFAIQPTIWKRDKFIELIKHSGGHNIWSFESDAQNTCKNRDILGYYIEESGRKRGEHHYDSIVYPYIATAVVGGSWNTREYPNELSEIFKTYNIDLSLRKTNG